MLTVCVIVLLAYNILYSKVRSGYAAFSGDRLRSLRAKMEELTQAFEVEEEPEGTYVSLVVTDGQLLTQQKIVHV